jgi:hypothetical protein
MSNIKDKLLLALQINLTFPESSKLQQRGIADKIEADCADIIKSNFNNVTAARSRRSIEDVTVEGCYVDVKTSDQALKFKMPNLISIDRLIKLDKPLYYVFVSYNSETKQIVSVNVLNVYELNWDHLQIQNLGVGQLQIKNMQSFMQSCNSNLTKAQWLSLLKKNAVQFYDNLIKKTQKRKKKWEDL